MLTLRLFQLEMADDYEAGDYQRVQAPLGFGELEAGARQKRAPQGEPPACGSGEESEVISTRKGS
jgi:hypothetical protein